MDKTSVARRSISAESAVAQDHTESEIDSTRYARAHYDWLLSQRKAGRILQVSGQSVGRWVKKYADSLPAQPPKPATSEVTELDELHTFVRSKKTNVI